MATELTTGEFQSLFAKAEPAVVPDGIGDKVLIDLVDGRVVDLTDADSLIDSLELADETNGKLQSWRRTLKERIAALAAGEKKTERVKGKRRLAKITQPDSSWDQSILKEAYNAYPDLRDDLLAIASLRVKKREFNKAVGTTGPADYMQFVKMISSAEREPTALPTIKIEE